MSRLLDQAPYGQRDETLFLKEMNELTAHHISGCEPYRRVWPHWSPAGSPESLPFLHVGVFKHTGFKTDAEGLRFERTLKSSATTSGTASRIPLDKRSSELQARSTASILKHFLGDSLRPLLILDNSRSLSAGGEISARIAAAMSLRPLASEMNFLLGESENPLSMNWGRLRCALEQHDSALVYGFTWMLWQAWGDAEMPGDIQRLIAGKTIHFVHSGGWKKLEAMKVGREQFDAALLRNLGPDSRVLDFYGLVEQVGVIFPLCECGSRHVPVWAGVLARDPWTLQPLPAGEAGMLQLMNTLAWGAPYHSVLTEDLGRIVLGECSQGRSGPRFELLGRIPKAEVRGCANV